MIGVAAAAAAVALGVPGLGEDAASQPAADLVVTVPAPAPPPAVWPLDGWGTDGWGTDASESVRTPGPSVGEQPATTVAAPAADVAQAFVRTYLGLPDEVVPVNPTADPQARPPVVAFDVVRGAAPVTTLIMREIHGSWTVAQARSDTVNLTVEPMDADTLAVHGQAPPGTWVQATLRESGGEFLELARAGARVGPEGVYALVLHAAPAQRAGGAVVVTTQDRATYAPVEAVAVEPVGLLVEPD